METIRHSSSAGGVIIRKGEVLLIRSLLRRVVGFPKGTIDEGESIEAAALREVKEETGYDTVILDNLGSSTFEFDKREDGKHYIKTVTYFLMELANDNEPVTDLQKGEDFESYWVRFEQAIAELTFEDTKEMLAKALKSSKLPI